MRGEKLRRYDVLRGRYPGLLELVPDLLDPLQNAQEVESGQSFQVVLAPSGSEKFGEENGVGRDVAEALRRSANGVRTSKSVYLREARRSDTGTTNYKTNA